MLITPRFAFCFQNDMSCRNQTKTDKFSVSRHGMPTYLYANRHNEACYHVHLRADLSTGSQ